MPSDKDIVIEARQLLASVPEFCADSAKIKHALFADAVERERESPFWGWTTQTAKAYAGFPELLRALADEVERLRDLIVHMHVHSGYRNNGYMQMTTPQKALYDAIWQRSVEELDAEEGNHNANS